MHTKLSYCLLMSLGLASLSLMLKSQCKLQNKPSYRYNNQSFKGTSTLRVASTQIWVIYRATK